VLHEALDGAALAGRVAPFEDEDVAAAGLDLVGWNLSSSTCRAYFSTS
jgi:hypothetical protein